MLGNYPFPGGLGPYTSSHDMQSNPSLNCLDSLSQSNAGAGTYQVIHLT